MARQIQIRRGTQAEHENFTGAVGEITVDTTNNTIRVHDGKTMGGTILAKQSEIPTLSDSSAGIDCVTKMQHPTAENNYTWYRKYKSGWVEQGGIVSGQTQDYNIVLPVAMRDTNYTVSALADNNTGVAGSFTMIDGGSQTTSGFVLVVNFYGTQAETKRVRWAVFGVAA